MSHLLPPLDYAENYDQLEELKSESSESEHIEHPDYAIIEFQEDNYI